MTPILHPQIAPYGHGTRAKWPDGCTHLENGMIIGAAEAYEADNAEPGPTPEDSAMESPDCFADWLLSECGGHGRVIVPSFPMGAGQMECAVERCTVPQLALLVIGHRADIRSMAGDVLRQRYLTAMGVA